MVITCELRQTPGWFNRDTISVAHKCSDSPTEIRPQSLIGMHPLSPPLTICGTVLKESDSLLIVVPRAVSQRLCILRKSWRVFHDRSLLWRCFRGFVLPVLEYCSAVWCSAADTHLKLLDRAVSGAQFLTGGVFECDISHRRSVAILCMLYKIRCNLVHPLNGALPGPYVPVRVTRGALVAHRYTYAPPRCRTSQYRKIFFPLSVSLWNDLANPVLYGVGPAGFKRRANVFFIGPSCSISTIVFYNFFLSLLSVHRLVLWGWGLRTDRVYINLSQPCTA